MTPEERLAVARERARAEKAARERPAIVHKNPIYERGAALVRAALGRKS